MSEIADHISRLIASLATEFVRGYSFVARIELERSTGPDAFIDIAFRDGVAVDLTIVDRYPTSRGPHDVWLRLPLEYLDRVFLGTLDFAGLISAGRYGSSSVASLSYFHGVVGRSTAQSADIRHLLSEIG